MSPEFLLGARLALHVATATILLAYCRPEARFRLGPSVIAGLLASSSAAMAVQIVIDWHDLIQHRPQPQLLIFVATVFLPVAVTRGDVAKIYDALRRLRPTFPFWR